MCQDCDEYSLLGRYLEKDTIFEGEYSFVHNSRIETDELLCRFLMAHQQHTLRMIPDRSEEYRTIISNASRYKEKDIDRFVEQSMQQKQLEKDEVSTEKALGQLQLTICKQMLEEEVKDVANIKATAPAKSQFLLGKEEGLKKAINILEDLIEKTNSMQEQMSEK